MRPRLTLTWVRFLFGTVPLVFIYDFRKFVTLWTMFSFILVNVNLFFHMWTATHTLQFSSRTVLLNFVWLSHNALSLATSLLVFFYFIIHHTSFVWNATPLCLFFWAELSHFYLCECHIISLCFHYFNVDTPFYFHLGHNWPILVLILCGLPKLIS